MVVAVLAAVVAAISGGQHGTGDNTAAGSRNIAAETAVRNQAAAWVADQVGRDVDIACDAVMCADLAQRGFPAGDLNVLSPTAPDPYGSQLVIATADIASQFGSKLASVYAPQVVAAFGTGADRIAIRAIAPDGPAAFARQLSADVQARRSSGTQLAGNTRVTTTTAARAELTSGQVDLRLVTTIAFLARQQPVSIVGFGTYDAAASPDVPLRTAYLATSDPVARLTGTAYLTALAAVLRSQVPPYVPLSTRTTDYGGQPVLQIVFSAPSPLDLLKS